MSAVPWGWAGGRCPAGLDWLDSPGAAGGGSGGAGQRSLRGDPPRLTGLGTERKRRCHGGSGGDSRQLLLGGAGLVLLPLLAPLRDARCRGGLSSALPRSVRDARAALVPVRGPEGAAPGPEGARLSPSRVPLSVYAFKELSAFV